MLAGGLLGTQDMVVSDHHANWGVTLASSAARSFVAYPFKDSGDTVGVPHCHEFVK